MSPVVRPTDQPDGPVARRQLLLLGCVQVLAMATWFAASAAAPALSVEWSLGTTGAAVLTTAVQVGFVLGALASALLNVADAVEPTVLMAIGSLAAAATTALVALVATGVVTAVVLRVLTGAALALVYPIGMKVAISWFERGRSFAVGALVGALTLGSTLPHALSGYLGDDWRPVLLVTSALAVLAALLLHRVRVGPLVSRSTRLDPRVALALLRERRPRLAVLGYLGHSWELYAVWVWVPSFAAASFAARGTDVSAGTVGLLAFAALGVAGLAGCLLAGRLADRVGGASVAAAAMVTSGACCLLAAATFGGPAYLLVPLLVVWGASVIADSPLFSACLGSVVPREQVGTALTLQTALGYLLTVVTIQGLPVVAALGGWRLAVALLAIGPLLGAVAMVRLAPEIPTPVRAVRVRT